MSLLWEQTTQPELNAVLPSHVFLSLSVTVHMGSRGTGFSELNICTSFTSLYFHTLLAPWQLPRLVFSSFEAWQASGHLSLLEEKKKRAAKRMSQRFTAASICHPEDKVYEVYDFVLFIGYNVKCREPCLLICQKHGSYSLPRGGGDWRETEWSARLDYCPGAMVTGTNRYCISLIWIRVGGWLSPHSHTHKHTWTFNDSYLIGKGALRRGQTPPGWCVDVQGASKCSWMALMRVANGDIKREWVHFSL